MPDMFNFNYGNMMNRTVSGGNPMFGARTTGSSPISFNNYMSSGMGANPMMAMQQMIPAMMQMMVMKLIFQQIGNLDGSSSGKGKGSYEETDIGNGKVQREYKDRKETISGDINTAEGKKTEIKYNNRSSETIKETDIDGKYTKTQTINKSNAIKMRAKGAKEDQGYNSVTFTYENDADEKSPTSIAIGGKVYKNSGKLKDEHPIYETTEGKKTHRYQYTDDGVLVEV